MKYWLVEELVNIELVYWLIDDWVYEELVS